MIKRKEKENEKGKEKEKGKGKGLCEFIEEVMMNVNV